MPLIRPDRADGLDLDALRSRAAEIETLIDERRAELARTRADLRVFELDYRQQVGTLHDELDELEAAIAEIELGELVKDPEVDGAGQGDGDSAAARACRPENPPRLTSDAVRKLFRDVAKVIHPDLARDHHSRDRRHALMVEANEAYVLGDEERLRSILDAWDKSPEAVQGTDPAAVLERFVRRVAQLEDEAEALTADLAELRASPLAQLKAMVDEAAGRGKDLMADMIARLKRGIMVARHRLDAIRPASPPPTV